MNFSSPEWVEISRLVTDRIAQLDEHNRKPVLSYEETCYTRGQIASLQWLMEWPKRVEAESAEPPEELNLQP